MEAAWRDSPYDDAHALHHLRFNYIGAESDAAVDMDLIAELADRRGECLDLVLPLLDKRFQRIALLPQRVQPGIQIS